MNKFVTETDTEYVKKQSYVTTGVLFVFFALVACLGLLISKQLWALLEIIVILACALAIFSKKQDRHNFRFRFEGSTLHVESKAGGGSFILRDMPASDFVIRQSGKEKKLDYCTLLIKDTTFAFGGVKNCSGLKAHIENNCI